MKTFTKEQKKEYFKNLREEWKKSKELADADNTVEALYRESGLTGFSYYSFYFTHLQMQARGLEGLPYIDCKTYNGWKDAGFKVKKGEKSVLHGITWIGKEHEGENGTTEEDSTWLFPKVYNLLHKTQVEEIME